MAKKKSSKKTFLKRLLIVLVILILFVISINIPIITLDKQTVGTDYSGWMQTTLDNSQRVVDVAMLGAHDAFTSEMKITSRVDELSADSIMQGVPGFFLKGFIYRQSVTQVVGATDLLFAGVRYLDIRLTYDEGEWYTKHNYIASDFIPILSEIKDFLETFPGEFLILDFQHIHGLDYSSQTDYDVFYQMLEDSGILDYTYEVTNLSDLTYGQLTANGTEAKAILISKFEDSQGKIMYYNDSMRSEWANSDDFDQIMTFLENEAETVLDLNLLDRFRVMQAVSTMQMNPAGIIKALGSWSLINRADSFNYDLLNYDDLGIILESLPILMVDYANDSNHGINDALMQIIMDFNRNS